MGHSHLPQAIFTCLHTSHIHGQTPVTLFEDAIPTRPHPRSKHHRRRTYPYTLVCDMLLCAVCGVRDAAC